MDYTKGEWKRNSLEITVLGSGTIAKIPTVQDGGVFEFVANSYLISSTPLLYEALKKLLKVYGITEDDTDHIQSWKDALTAIARAEGR